MKRISVGIILLLILAVLLARCGRQRWLEVEPGEYTRVHGTDAASRAVARQIRSLSLDRDLATATLTFDDGSQIPLALVARQRSEWPEGCPTNLIQHHMEVLEVEASNLSIASMTFQEPVLVRNCPRDPLEIVLREDGPIGGSGTACRDSCLVFSRVGSSTPEAAILGQWQGAGYAYLRGHDGSSLMFWYDNPGAARCQTHTMPGNQLYRASCSVQSATGPQIEWEVTIGDTQAGVTINGTYYDFEMGRLFLMTTHDDDTLVVQLDRDLSAVEPLEEEIIAFAESVPEILQLARQTSPPGDVPSPTLPGPTKDAS